jgi:Transposase and inactivated derivatives
MSKKPAPTITIGIDVAKDSCDACFLDGSERINHQGHYPEEKYKALAKKIEKAQPRIVILEATGGYERAIAGLLVAADIPFRIVSPSRARQFANSIGLLGKNDAIDARMLALYALRNNIEPAAAPDEKTQELRALLDRRRQLVDTRTAEKNRRLRANHKAAAKSIEKVIALLDAEIVAIDRLLDEMVKDDDEFRHKEDILTSVPGVGKQTARTLLGSMPELGQVNRAQAAALAGLAPFARDSGKQHGKRIIRAGRFYVRRALYMAAVSAIQFNPRFKEMYKRLVALGKAKKLALTACMRKLLLLLNALLKKDELFNP